MRYGTCFLTNYYNYFYALPKCNMFKKHQEKGNLMLLDIPVYGHKFDSFVSYILHTFINCDGYHNQYRCNEMLMDT